MANERRWSSNGSRPRPRNQAAYLRPARQRRVLGCGDQARPGTRSAFVSRLHAQGVDRCRISRVCGETVQASRRDLSAVRHSQRAHACRGAGNATARCSMSNFSACMAWARCSMTKRKNRSRIPARTHLRAGRPPRGAAVLSGATVAGERREQLVRQSLHERECLCRNSRRGSDHDRRKQRIRSSIRTSRCRRDLYGDSRENSAGVDWGNPHEVALQVASLQRHGEPLHVAASSLAGATSDPSCGSAKPGGCHRSRRSRGASEREDIELAFNRAATAHQAWDGAGAAHRAECLVAAADALRANRAELVRLLVKEAGKTLPDAIAEVREAEDFCRYYAAQARESVRRADSAAGPDRRRQQAELARPRRVRLHQSMEFPAGHFHGPGDSGAGGRQHA